MSSRRNRKNSMADNDDDDDDDDNEFHDCLDASEETVSVSSAPAVHEGAAAGKLLRASRPPQARRVPQALQRALSLLEGHHRSTPPMAWNASARRWSRGQQGQAASGWQQTREWGSRQSSSNGWSQPKRTFSRGGTPLPPPAPTRCDRALANLQPTLPGWAWTRAGPAWLGLSQSPKFDSKNAKLF